MSQENPLTAVYQQTVPFHDDQITAVRVEDGTVYVPIRPICEKLGLAWGSQRNRINRDLVLSKVSTVVFVMNTTEGATSHQTNKMVCLPLDYLNGWLFGISTSRVKDEIRDALVKYQMDCYKVLANAFGRNLATARPDDALMNSDTPAAIAYRNALQLTNLARQQFYLEQRIESAELSITDTVSRVDAIEARLNDTSRHISLEQAQRISEAVKAVAFELGSQTGRNEYQGVYGELYRRYQVPSYRELPTSKFDDCINWLRQWYQSLTDADAAPF